MKHPTQEVEKRDGVFRFVRNEIVSDLIDGLVAQDLNVIVSLVARGRYSREDYSQLMQLVGYSLSGFGDLSHATDEARAEADRLLCSWIDAESQGSA